MNETILQMLISRRSLTLFSRALSAFLVLSLIQRGLYFNAWFSTQGVLPPSLYQSIIDPWAFSFHQFGKDPLRVSLMLLEGIAAIALGFGYRTRLAAISAWTLEISLQHLNPLILDASDHMLSLALFWLIFLIPHSSKTSRLGYGLQILSIYVFSVFAKIKSGVWIMSGSRSGLALSLHDGMTTEWGKAILGFPNWILQFLSVSVIGLELLGPFLILFLPPNQKRIRIGAIALFLIFHFSIGLTLGIWRFSILCMILWIPFLPLTMHSETFANTSLSTLSNRIQSAIAGFIIGLCLLANGFSIGIIPHSWITPFHPVLTLFNLEQNWNMFTDASILNPSSFRIFGTQSNGAQTELPSSEEWARNPRWRVYLENTAQFKSSDSWNPLIQWICRNSSEMSSLESIQIREQRPNQKDLQSASIPCIHQKQP
jgi:hypothetical protein